MYIYQKKVDQQQKSDQMVVLYYHFLFINHVAFFLIVMHLNSSESHIKSKSAYFVKRG